MKSLKYSPKEFIPTTTNISPIECSKAWSQLNNRERFYAYYLSRAAWEGAKICWFQRSYESPALLILFKLLFSQNLNNLKQKVLKSGLEDNDFRQMLAYSAAVFQNCGNYKAFGDTKFVPEVEPEKFKQIIKCGENYETHKEIIDKILELTEKEIFSETDPYF